MKKKRWLLDFYIPKVYLLIYLVIASFYLSGCATSAAPLDESEADKKASLELNCEYYWKIQRVVSAIKHKNGDISICVRLVSPVQTESPILKTITIPLSNLTGDNNTIDAIEKLGLSPDKCIFNDAICFWHPIEEAKIGCNSLSSGTSSSAIILPVENISTNSKSRNQLYTRLDNLSKSQPATEKIYEVRFVFDEENKKEEGDTDNIEVV